MTTNGGAKPAKKAKSAQPKVEPSNTLQATPVAGEKPAVTVARAMVRPDFRHGVAIAQTLRPLLGSIPEFPGSGDFADAVALIENDAAKGDLSFASGMLAAQAVTLDNLFAELARRAAANMGEYLPASETYARMAFKAQSNCRATLEALAKLHQPREQTVRHVHVNEGGQAVIADQFHHHTGGHQNAESDEQPHATGTVAAGSGPAMLGHDAQGNGLPIPRDKGREAMPDARRQGQRRT